MTSKPWIHAATTLLATSAMVTVALAQDKSKSNIKVVIFAVNGSEAMTHTMVETAAAAAKARGWTVETYDGTGDQVATNNQINTYINRGFDAIINVASANTQMGPVIANAAKAKIPFVSAFSGMVPGITVDIGSNNVGDGVLSASAIAARINGEGEVLKMNWTVLPATAERDAGFHAVMNEYKNIKVTDMELKVPGQVDDAFNKVTDFLAGHKNVKAIWMGWDEVGIAAARAVQQSHLEHKPFVVSVNGDQAAFDLIRGDSPFWLTVAYDPKGIATRAVQAVADAVDGKPFPERQIYTKPCLITKQTVPAKGESPDFKTCVLYSADLPQASN